MKKIQKILIANRGEIALRIIRACRELEIKSVSLFSEVDIEGVWVRKADEAYPILGDPIEAYLNYDRIISLAKKADCDAIHPGYGFLSENGDFARACKEAGIIFIGPKAEHIDLFGDKIASKRAMKELGVPILPGTIEPIANAEEGRSIAEEIGYPVIIKAAFGGGGRGMRIVTEAGSFSKLFEEATQESLRFFGKDEVFVEKYLENPRHIEVQIIADSYGNVVHLSDRDCSIQRRHQKVVEIAPAPNLSNEIRKELYRASTKAMFRLGYESVGTMEFLVDSEDHFYFMEMNTRIQVEHTITEMISGLDLVKRMIEIAEGDKLQYLQEDISFKGYAIEFRINAEDVQNDFAPAPGTINNYLAPGGFGVRMDGIAYSGYKIPPHYDSMIGKLIVYALDWRGVMRKARRALSEYVIEGVPTNIPLHQQIVKDADFVAARFDTGYLEKKLSGFNLEAQNALHAEEERMKKLTDLIDSIRAQDIKVRY